MTTSQPLLWQRTLSIIVALDTSLKHHFIRDAIEDGEVQLDFCRSEDQVADILTKALQRDRFQQLRDALGIR